MTRNQISYWQNVETERSNKAREAETHRSNLVQEGETHRHNLMTEALGFQTLQETQRHNRAYEDETQRHNIATETLGVQQLQETQRHNVASETLGYYTVNAQTAAQRYVSELNSYTTLKKASMETETSRYNVGRQVGAQMYGADLGYNAAALANQTRVAELDHAKWSEIRAHDEKVRHNLVTESNEAQKNRITALTNKGHLLIDQQHATLETADWLMHNMGRLLGPLKGMLDTAKSAM